MSSPWYTVASITTGDNSDCYAVLQGLLDDIAALSAGASGSRTVAVPCGDATISHPLWVKASKIAIIGDPSGGTRLKPTDWQGATIVVRLPRDNIPTGASLATGTGAAYHFGGTEGGLDLSSVEVLGELGLQPKLTVSGFIKPNDITGRATSPLTGCGYNYGVSARQTGIYALADGSVNIVWKNVAHTSAAGLIANDTEYYCEWSFDGTLGTPTVTVWLGVPGGTAANVLQFTVSDTTFPQLRGGAEPWAIGYFPDGMAGVAAGGERTTDMYFDGMQWSDTVRHTSAFTCPTTKPDPDAHTILVLNGELEDPWVIGHLVLDGGESRTQYIVPMQGDGDSHLLTGFVLRDIEASNGVLLHHVPEGRLRDVSVETAWQGLVLAGVCFSAVCDTIIGACGSCGIFAGPQVETSAWRNINVSGGGIPLFFYGAVGGEVNGVVAMADTQFATAYITGTNAIRFASLQVDDETVDSTIPHSIICHGATLKVSGGLFPRVARGPIFECVGGGSVCLYGVDMYAFGSSTHAGDELIKFYDAPLSNAVALGCPTLDVPGMTLSPHYCFYDQFGVTYHPKDGRG